MKCSRVYLGPVAAVLAVVCVLGPAPPAPASAELAGGERGGFSGLLLDRARCCGPGGPQADIAFGVDGLAAGGGAGGQARPAGPALAQAEQAAEAPETPQNPETSPATESPDPDAIKDSEMIPLTVPEVGGDSFKGSMKPAGPDLTPEEERELITGGWN